MGLGGPFLHTCSSLLIQSADTFDPPTPSNFGWLAERIFILIGYYTVLVDLNLKKGMGGRKGDSFFVLF